MSFLLLINGMASRAVTVSSSSNVVPARVSAVTRVDVPNSIRVAVILAVVLALVAVIIAFLWPIYFSRFDGGPTGGMNPIMPIIPVGAQWRIVNVSGPLNLPFVPVNQELYVLDTNVTGTFTIGSAVSTPAAGKSFIISNALRNSGLNIAPGQGVTLLGSSRSIPASQAGWFVWLDNNRLQQILVQNQPR